MLFLFPLLLCELAPLPRSDASGDQGCEGPGASKMDTVASESEQEPNQTRRGGAPCVRVPYAFVGNNHAPYDTERHAQSNVDGSVHRFPKQVCALVCDREADAKTVPGDCNHVVERRRRNHEARDALSDAVASPLQVEHSTHYDRRRYGRQNEAKRERERDGHAESDAAGDTDHNGLTATRANSEAHASGADAPNGAEVQLQATPHENDRQPKHAHCRGPSFRKWLDKGRGTDVPECDASDEHAEQRRLAHCPQGFPAEKAAHPACVEGETLVARQHHAGAEEREQQAEDQEQDQKQPDDRREQLEIDVKCFRRRLLLSHTAISGGQLFAARMLD
mmetsp:Transcript_113093/g.320044  ORF Transcript_113093/g.320044 Transcript_113093/m.320044 type:complete len:335 (+) Transcript_113093:1283-2287(+)